MLTTMLILITMPRCHLACSACYQEHVSPLAVLHTEVLLVGLSTYLRKCRVVWSTASVKMGLWLIIITS